MQMASISDFLLRLPPLYQHARYTIEHVARAGPEELKRYQTQQIKRVLAWARNLPEETYQTAADLNRMPLLSKDEIRLRPQAFVRHSYFPTSNKQTSGTSGAALAVRRSLNSVIFEQAAIDWVLDQAGFDLSRSRVAVLRGSDIKSLDDESPPYWRPERFGRYLVFSSNHLNRSTVKSFHEALTAFKPDILYVYPSIADHLSRLLEGENLRLRCAVVLTSSESLPNESRKRLAETFAAPVIDIYGQAERVSFAYSLEPDAYRFLPAYSLTELIPQEQNKGVEIVGTAFHNSAQVLIRYRTGDLIELQRPQQSLDDVANGVETFKAISGRLNDVLFGPSGEILVGIDHIPRGLNSIGRLQFVQKDLGFVQILVQKNGPESPADEDVILKKARIKLPKTMRIEVRFVEELRRTRAGKVPFVIHELAELPAIQRDGGMSDVRERGVMDGLN